MNVIFASHSHVSFLFFVFFNFVFAACHRWINFFAHDFKDGCIILVRFRDASWTKFNFFLDDECHIRLTITRNLFLFLCFSTLFLQRAICVSYFLAHYFKGLVNLKNMYKEIWYTYGTQRGICFLESTQKKNWWRVRGAYDTLLIHGIFVKRLGNVKNIRGCIILVRFWDASQEGHVNQCQMLVSFSTSKAQKRREGLL